MPFMNIRPAFCTIATETKFNNRHTTRRLSHYSPPISRSYSPHCSAEDTPTHTVTYRGRRLQAHSNELLRNVLLRHSLHPHNGGRLITCRGLGTCGTCAVSITSGTVHPCDMSWREKARLFFPPHTAENAQQRRLRLACQVTIVEDVEVEKYAGFWGHKETVLDRLED